MKESEALIESEQLKRQIQDMQYKIQSLEEIISSLRIAFHAHVNKSQHEAHPFKF